jgi:hypothetical protein
LERFRVLMSLNPEPLVTHARPVLATERGELSVVVLYHTLCASYHTIV